MIKDEERRELDPGLFLPGGVCETKRPINALPVAVGNDGSRHGAGTGASGLVDVMQGRKYKIK